MSSAFVALDTFRRCFIIIAQSRASRQTNRRTGCGNQRHPPLQSKYLSPGIGPGYNSLMSPTADKILQQILALPDEERAELTARLLEATAESPPGWASAEIEAAWGEEIHERVAAAGRGEIPTLSQEEVDGRLKAKYGFLAD
jgi:hypothetical protein